MSPKVGIIERLTQLGVKRYDLMTNYRCGTSVDEMESADDGEWVRYEDVIAALACVIEERDALLSPPLPGEARADDWLGSGPWVCPKKKERR